MKSILFLFCLLISIPSLSQEKYSKTYAPILEFATKKILPAQLVSEKDKQVYKFIIYLPPAEHSINSCFYCGILVLQLTSSTKYWVIENESIHAKGTLSKTSIFSYQHLFRTGVTEKESTLKFVPPFLNGIKTEGLIYQDRKTRFFFEYGKNISAFLPDPNKNPFRKEWLSIIRKELKRNKLL